MAEVAQELTSATLTGVSSAPCERCLVVPKATTHPNCKYCAVCRKTHDRQSKHKARNDRKRAEIAARPVLMCVKCEKTPRASKDPRTLYCEECYWAEKRERQIARIKLVPRPKQDRERKKKYGLTPDMFDSMLEVQGNCCAICRCSFETNTVHVDHCHKSGVVRGLLCRRCNLDAGILETLADKSLLLPLVDYLMQDRLVHLVR